MRNDQPAPEVRPLRPEDVPWVTAITNREIEQGWAHFSTEPLSVDEVRAAYESRQGTHPAFVATLADRSEQSVVGYAHAYPWKPRGAYRWSTEIGVYVDPAHSGKGLGRLLYGALFPELERMGFRTIIAGITLPNDASVRLHESFGMTSVGVFPSVGFKMQAWRDVGYWVRHLGEGPPASLHTAH